MDNGRVKLERAVVFYKGHVQGVGFRYTCRSIAMGFSVTGYVKNLEDGRVEMVAEGEPSELEDFLKDIEESHLKSFIHQKTVDWRPATGDWKDFHISH